MKNTKHTKYYEWQLKIKSGTEKCVKCGDTRRLSLEHIVPTHFLIGLGLDENEIRYNFEENFEILCGYCNQEKAGRLEPRHPKTYTLLRHFIDIAQNQAFPSNETKETTP